MIAAAAVVMVVCWQLGAYLPVAAGAQPVAAHRWTFESPQDADGWVVGNHLKDLAVADGRLRMTITGPDAFLFAPPVEVPLDGCVIRVRLRGDRDGSTQVYWRTRDPQGQADPHFGEFAVMSRFTPGSAATVGRPAGEGFVTVEFPIGKPTDAGRTLIALRIDPYNGNPEGMVEIDLVEVIRQPPVLEVRFALESHRIEAGRPATARAKLRQTAGMACPEALDVVMPGGHQVPVTVTTTGWAAAEGKVQIDGPGAHRERLHVRSREGKPVLDLDTSVIVSAGQSLPLTPGLQSGRTRLDFVATPDGKQVGGARWQIAGGKKEGAPGPAWLHAGWLVPLVQVTIERPDGQIVRREPAMTVVERTDQAARLSAALDDEAGWQAELDLQLVEKQGHEVIAVVARLSGPQGGQLLDFAGPVLRADREPAGDLLDRFALFGGLEFLEPGWPSSGDRAVGEKLAERWSPHPFKVTLPLMAVQAGGVTSALMWQALDTWDGVEAMPTATFASPNFLDDQPNHLMRLSVPTIPQWREENETAARRPYPIRAAQPLSVRSVLFAEKDLPVALAARRWYEVLGPATAPLAPHDDRALYDLLARHYGETMYWPAQKGWRHHWYLGDSSGYVGFMAAEVVAHAVQTGDRQWIERTGLAERTIIDAAGTLADRLKHDGGARAQMAAMRPDGTWPFVNTPQMREQVRKFTEGRHDSLGEDGSTSLGTCVQAAMPILRYAELTGESACMAAAEKALKAMRQFRVPRGAQVWEVHQDIPDIRAAALAVEAYRIGYHLTGDKSYLDDAHYWAWTGVPFLYSWHVPIERHAGSMVASRDKDDWKRLSMPLGEGFQNPNRQVTPYATVPVLGPTFYVISWFGVVVQWCGLEWAWKVIELDADRPDPILRYVADGVVASGLQQTFDRPPWVGLFPDVWDLQQNIAHGAFICAMLPMHCLQAQGRLPCWTRTWTRVLRDDAGARRWHVSGWGRPVSLELPRGPGIWSATVAFPAGQPNELVVAGVDQPRRVRIAGQILEATGAAEADHTKPGWRYDPDLRTVAIRFVQAGPQTEVRIDW